MKIIKALGLLPILIALSFTAAFANDCSIIGLPPAYRSVLEHTAIRRTADFKSQAGLAIFTGAMASLDRQGQEIAINTIVPGFLGPQEREVPFKVNNDTIVTVCFKSRNQCNSSPAGVYGWATFTSMEKLSKFSTAKKNVTVYQDIDTGNVIGVKIEYEL